MCGIFCEIIYKHSDESKQRKRNRFLQRIQNRGPDCNDDIEIQVNGITIYFYGAVLWMQGIQLASQPVESNIGVLLYNGDIFDKAWDPCKSDTQVIKDKLDEASSLDKHLRQTHIINVLKTLKGPFSLIYFDKKTQDLYFTRDRIGRSSLVFHRNEESIIISSVLDRSTKCSEISATAIQVLNINSNSMTSYNWNDDGINESNLNIWFRRLEETQSMTDEEHLITGNEDGDYDLDKGEEDLIKYIQDTALQHKGNNLKIMEHLLNNQQINSSVNRISQLLEDSVRIRLEKQPKRCKNCLKKSECSHCTVGILFSGGLDCTILALLADRHVHKDQPIDLINVAFNKDGSSVYDVPDRITGKHSYEELKKLCKTRKWVFREVNVPLQELQDYQSKCIADLVHPRQTILDESLGTALWFAARSITNDGTSPCRVLLLGSGADELFGGYTRHRNAFKRRGWRGLEQELLLDWSRISFRNLARDNRVICDHGRQPRMPYLDEDFAEYVLNLKPWIKCYPSELLGQGLGDKLVLRLVAFKLGLFGAMSFPKRALQFGSRIANKKERGCDISKNFLKRNE